MVSDTPIAVLVKTYLQRGEPKVALELLEGARKQALVGGDIASLREVLAGTRVVHAHADRKRRNQAVRIANAAQQNIRLLGRNQALAAGEEWVDPFASARPASSAPPASRGRALFLRAAEILAVLAGLGVLAVLAFLAWAFWVTTQGY